MRREGRLNPVTKVLKCSPLDIVEEVENHLATLFGGSVDPPGAGAGVQDGAGGHEAGGDDGVESQQLPCRLAD